jgi:hypothetical protein
MALEIETGPRAVRLAGLPRTAARGPWAMVAAGRLLAAYCAECLTHTYTLTAP